MYIPVCHTNRRPFTNTIGVVMNRLVGMALYGWLMGTPYTCDLHGGGLSCLLTMNIVIRFDCDFRRIAQWDSAFSQQQPSPDTRRRTFKLGLRTKQVKHHHFNDGNTANSTWIMLNDRISYIFGRSMEGPWDRGKRRIQSFGGEGRCTCMASTEIVWNSNSCWRFPIFFYLHSPAYTADLGSISLHR